jgi:biotin carboxyl carrier protein
MAVYQVTIGDNEYRIEISEDGVRINGEEVDADLFELNEAGLFLLNHGDEKLELHLASEGSNTYLITTEGQQIQAQVETDQGQKRRKKAASDNKELIAPIPGVVLEVHVHPGDLVEEGQTACILESMKMQMVIKLPAGGKVSEVNIEPKQSVAKGDVMITLE